MAIICSNCGRQYDITLFEFGRKVKCDCGNIIDLKTQGMNRKELKEKIEEIFKEKNQNDILS